MNKIQRTLSAMLIAASLNMAAPWTAQAAIIPTEAALPGAASAREKVVQTLSRADIRDALQAHGLSSSQALARVDAMTDAEVESLAQRMDQAPAGGDILGLLFTVFIVLLVTDVLGLTKVFPFTRSIR